MGALCRARPPTPAPTGIVDPKPVPTPHSLSLSAHIFNPCQHNRNNQFFWWGGSTSCIAIFFTVLRKLAEAGNAAPCWVYELWIVFQRSFLGPIIAFYNRNTPRSVAIAVLMVQFIKEFLIRQCSLTVRNYAQVLILGIKWLIVSNTSRCSL